MLGAENFNRSPGRELWLGVLILVLGPTRPTSLLTGEISSMQTRDGSQNTFDG